VVSPSHRATESFSSLNPRDGICLARFYFPTGNGRRKNVYEEILAAALPHLTLDEIELMSRQLQRIELEPGELVFSQGDDADCFYIIEEGQVEIILQQTDGTTRVLAMRETGDFFGEIGLLMQGKRTATVRAKTPARLLALEEQDFDAALQASEQTRKRISEVAERRLANLDKPQA
jgi:CRP-like cAMP-binding protein